MTALGEASRPARSKMRLPTAIFRTYSLLTVFSVIGGVLRSRAIIYRRVRCSTIKRQVACSSRVPFTARFYGDFPLRALAIAVFHVDQSHTPMSFPSVPAFKYRLDERSW